MKDSYGRTIDYLRISLTDRCNLRCFYCMPKDREVSFIPQEQILSPQEIIDFARISVDMGIRKIRLTGGEPLLRKEVIYIVRELSSIRGLEDLSMTTNGILLKEFAHRLASAGLQRINISLDTVDAHKYREITGGGHVRQVLEGIQSAKEAGFSKIKINCVVKESSLETDARGVRTFAHKEGLEVRFIRRMDMEKGIFDAVEGGQGGICHICNRLRLTCNGDIRPCLFSDLAFNIKEMGIDKAIESALAGKPPFGGKSYKCTFNHIGG